MANYPPETPHSVFSFQGFAGSCSIDAAGVEPARGAAMPPRGKAGAVPQVGLRRANGVVRNHSAGATRLTLLHTDAS